MPGEKNTKMKVAKMWTEKKEMNDEKKLTNK